MSDDSVTGSEAEPIEVRCYYVRERNALLVRGEFSPIYTDYYLHLMEHQIRYEPEMDQLLKDSLAALTLHLASRPRNEAVAWTLNWQNPLLNLFVTGSNRQGNITGRIFTEDVRSQENNVFISQLSADGQPGRQSMIEVDDLNFFGIGESFYSQSEQRMGRFFRYDEEDFVLVTAQPDCDEAWLSSLDAEKIRDIDETEELSLLETRQYRFDCGCSQERIFPIISGMNDSSVESMFGDREVIPAGCPRCGAKYVITRESLEAFVREQE
tara:strand:- start:3401 stop:4204 length:804 start_codon:yes stop_codon:yes gene_type:complete